MGFCGHHEVKIELSSGSHYPAGMKPAFITIWILCTIAWVIIALVALSMPEVSREMTLLNESVGTKWASRVFGLLVIFGPPLVVYALGLMIASRRTVVMPDPDRSNEARQSPRIYLLFVVAASLLAYLVFLN
jgi:hypothetical protein